MADTKVYWFPDSLKESNFSLRKMTINIYKLKTFAKTGKELKDKIIEAGVKLADFKFVDAIKEINEFEGDIITTIALPIPNELNDSAQHGWTVDTGFTKALSDFTGATSLQDGVLAKAANLAGKNKTLANPGYFQNYTGSEPRNFTFTYTFVPNNSSEADNLVDIILLLKKYSSPTKTIGGLALTAPHFFHVSFGNQKINRMANIRPCVIANIETNYSGAGYLETTMDGMPKMITLSITFNEIRAITSENWDI